MSDNFDFEDAAREQSKARVSLTGPSGSGKTYTALVLATILSGPDGRIGVIDTERKSASKYAPPFRFKRLNMTHYHPDELVKALVKAEQAGIDTVIVDSWSKFWSGSGGMLELVDASTGSMGNNQFGGWKVAKPTETAALEALLAYPGHVIVTMRAKHAYEIVTDDQGKKKPVRLGLAPDQRKDSEYEFDFVFDMDASNTLSVAKSRDLDMPPGTTVQKPDGDFGQRILTWLNEGKFVAGPSDYRNQAEDPAITVEGLQQLYRTVRDEGMLSAPVLSLRFTPGNVLPLGTLISERGKQANAQGSAAAEVDAETEAQWCAEFVAELAGVKTPEAAEELLARLDSAVAHGQVREQTAIDMRQHVAERARELTPDTPAAAA